MPRPLRCQARIFLVTPSGHERYLQELAELLARSGRPDQDAIAALRARHAIEQLTPLNPGSPGGSR